MKCYEYKINKKNGKNRCFNGFGDFSSAVCFDRLASGLQSAAPSFGWETGDAQVESHLPGVGFLDLGMFGMGFSPAAGRVCQPMLGDPKTQKPVVNQHHKYTATMQPLQNCSKSANQNSNYIQDVLYIYNLKQ